MKVEKLTNFIIKNSEEIIRKNVQSVSDLSVSSKSGNHFAQTVQDAVEISKEGQFLKELNKHFSKDSISVDINGNISTWSRFLESQSGSQDAFWARNDKTGELFYIKFAANREKEGHIASEITAAKLYNLAGIDTPQIIPVTINGKIKGLASKYVPNLEEPKDIKVLRDGFAADAWLANWDSLVWRNTFIADGKIYKIDNGGALKYRAQGKLKDDFGDDVKELITLVDGRNYESTRAYSSMTHSELVKSFKRVCSISDNEICKAVEDPELAQTLINRKNYMTKVLSAMEKNPKQNENLAQYFAKLTKQLQEPKTLDSETVITELSKTLDKKIKLKRHYINMPATKTLAKDLVQQIKELEKNGTKISKEDIIKVLEDLVDEGLELKPAKYEGKPESLYEMENEYNKLFSTLLFIARKTPQKEGESATSYIKRIAAARERRVKQLEQFRINNIKSKLTYEPDSIVQTKTTLDKATRKRAIQELERQRKADALTGTFDIPHLTDQSTDYEIFCAWQMAHLGNFKFSNNELQKSIMELGGRYNSKHPIKVKVHGSDIAEKDYKQEFEIEPVYHWFHSSNPEDFVKKDLPSRGEIYSFPQRQCCSTHKYYAESDYGDHVPDQNIKFIIHPKSETSRAYNLGYNQEVVYPGGEQCRILDKSCVEYTDPKTGFGRICWEIHMQEI